jgi:hypothetical protein
VRKYFFFFLPKFKFFSFCPYEVGKFFENLELHKGVVSIFAVIHAANKYFSTEKPWTLKEKKVVEFFFFYPRSDDVLILALK